MNHLFSVWIHFRKVGIWLTSILLFKSFLKSVKLTYKRLIVRMEQYTREHLVEFAFWIENTEETGVAQIIFNNLAVLEDQNNRSDFLEKINELNRMYGLYYYLVLDVDNRVFARYVTHVTSQNYEILFDIFKKGTQIISEIIKELN